jgi:hypothetical protein
MDRSEDQRPSFRRRDAGSQVRLQAGRQRPLVSARSSRTSPARPTNSAQRRRARRRPHAEDEFEKSAKTKAEIVKALDGAIAYCDEIYKTLDDAKAAQVVNGAFGGPKGPRAAALFGNTGHYQEHYGNIVTYLRINGLVPPSSAPQK